MRRIFTLLAATLLVANLQAKVGTIIRDTIAGIPCCVYLPENIEKGKTDVTRIPVLYLQHGMYGNENDWAEQGHLLYWLDTLLQAGLIDERIIVMPDNCPSLPTAEEEKANATSGFWENHFAEFMAETEARYPVSILPAERAIAGLSMGGYHTMRVASLLDGQFAHVGMFSPATFVHEAPTKPALLWLGIGREDFLYDSVTEYRKWLDANGPEYVYYETEGGHTWPNWQDYLCRFLQAIRLKK